MIGIPVSTYTRSPLSSISRNTTGQRLEKHLDDLNKGRGELSVATGQLMQKVHVHTGLSLAQSNPSAALQYNAYQTAFGYHQKTRVALAVHDVQQTVTKIDEAKENADAFERELETILQEAQSAEVPEDSPSDKNSEQEEPAVNQQVQQAISKYLAVSSPIAPPTLISSVA